MTDFQRAFEYIGQLAELTRQENNIPGMAVAVTDRDGLLWQSTHGFADASAQTPLTSETLFEIASIGKSFTSIALLQLVDEGLLDLKAPVSQYLPWFQVKSTYPPITVHHLMNHTAGIIRGTELAPYGLYDSWALRNTKTAFAPGSHWYYSSLGYKTLGFLLEHITGQSYEQIIQARILDPLGMTHTHPSINFETRRKSAVGYRTFYDDRPEHISHGIVPAYWAEYGTADGSPASTAGDLAIYLRMLLNRGNWPQGRLVSEDNFSLMVPLKLQSRREQYGYAMVVYPVEERTYFGHGGGNAGFMCHILGDMEDGIGVVVFTNRVAMSDVVWPTAVRMLRALHAVKHNLVIPPPPSGSNPSFIPNASEYAGTYREDIRTLEVMAEGSRLLLNYNGSTVPLERRSRDSFYVAHPDLSLFLLEFRREWGRVVEAFHGGEWYMNDHYSGPRYFGYPKEWDAYPGHYRTRNPEISNFRVVLRKGILSIVYHTGFSEALKPLGDSLFRVGEDLRSPETLRFDAVVDGRALKADYSGCPYYRTFTP